MGDAVLAELILSISLMALSCTTSSASGTTQGSGQSRRSHLERCWTHRTGLASSRSTGTIDALRDEDADDLRPDLRPILGQESSTPSNRG